MTAIASFGTKSRLVLVDAAPSPVEESDFATGDLGRFRSRSVDTVFRIRGKPRIYAHSSNFQAQ